MSTPTPSTPRPSVIQLAIKEKAALYAAYIPLFADGGVVVTRAQCVACLAEEDAFAWYCPGIRVTYSAGTVAAASGTSSLTFSRVGPSSWNGPTTDDSGDTGVPTTNHLDCGGEGGLGTPSEGMYGLNLTTGDPAGTYAITPTPDLVTYQ